MSKLLLTSFILCATLSCSQKMTSSHFTIQKSTQEKWSPGMVQNKSAKGGSIYQVELKVKTSNTSLQFKKMIVGEQVMDIELMKGIARAVSGPFTKGDVLVVLARSESVNSFLALSESIQQKLKSNPSASGWLLYTLNGDEYVVPIKAFSPKKSESLNQ